MSAKNAIAAKIAASGEAVQVQTAQFNENVVYLMGLSFVLGCFFTILILILLDFMRRDQQPGMMK
ncbi:MAG: hypothetical protein ACKVOE_06070 [Rickettsiales bacterium]